MFNSPEDKMIRNGDIQTKVKPKPSGYEHMGVEGDEYCEICLMFKQVNVCPAENCGLQVCDQPTCWGKEYCKFHKWKEQKNDK